MAIFAAHFAYPKIVILNVTEHRFEKRSEHPHQWRSRTSCLKGDCTGVLCGSPVIADKKNPDILLTSPVSGTVKALVRGEKRKLLAVLIEADDEQKCIDFGVKDPNGMDAGQIRTALLESGLWPWIIQRPYGIIADPAARPSNIFVSAFDSAPLAADTDFCFGSEVKAIQAGINALAKLTDGEVHVSFDADAPNSELRSLNGIHAHYFKGKHPAGNVGVQISHIRPICKGDTVWTVSLLGLAAIGKLFTKGRYDLRRKVAVCGPMAIEPSYVETLPGMPMKELAGFFGSSAAQDRFISGNVLTGSNEGLDGYLGFFHNQITLLHEGTERELLGWLRPLRWKQFSTDHCYFSWLVRHGHQPPRRSPRLPDERRLLCQGSPHGHLSHLPDQGLPCRRDREDGAVRHL